MALQGSQGGIGRGSAFFLFGEHMLDTVTLDLFLYFLRLQNGLRLCFSSPGCDVVYLCEDNCDRGRCYSAFSSVMMEVVITS